MSTSFLIYQTFCRMDFARWFQCTTVSCCIQLRRYAPLSVISRTPGLANLSSIMFIQRTRTPWPIRSPVASRRRRKENDLRVYTIIFNELRRKDYFTGTIHLDMAYPTQFNFLLIYLFAWYRYVLLNILWFLFKKNCWQYVHFYKQWKASWKILHFI